MNLIVFLKQINEISDGYTKEQLSDFVHEIARVIPESERDVFLNKLQLFSKDKQKLSDKEKSGFDDKETYETIMKDLELIDSGEICIEVTYNEDYDEWDDDDDDDEEEYLYLDHDDIAGRLNNAFDYVHKCMDEENYKHGFEVGRKALSVNVHSSDRITSSYRIDQLKYYGLMLRDIPDAVYDTLYCGYMCLDDEDRIEDMYDLIQKAYCDVTIEGLMQHGDSELPEFDDFLEKWSVYLGEQSGIIAEALFNESVRLLDDPHKAIVLADKFADEHPGLYLQILTNSEGLTAEETVQLGIEAINRIPVNYVVRSTTALKVAELICKNKSYDPAMLEECYFAAYESDTTPVNYLQALLNGFDSPEKRDRLNRIIEEIDVEEDPYVYRYETGFRGELLENKPRKYTVAMLEFLAGEFSYVMQSYVNERKFLGWSNTFMKEGIALFLLYLYEGEWNTPGIKMMTEYVRASMEFSISYYSGDLAVSREEKAAMFSSVFHKWKSITPMEKEFGEEVLNRIELMMEMRTDAILEANRRRYYEECGSYIVALGEVRESLGDSGAKQRIITEYKVRYNRRPAFKSALDAYGLNR